jgi:thiol-disulfide isomerase/thioredoxin
MKKFGQYVNPRRIMKSAFNKKGNFLYFALAVVAIFVALYYLSKWSGVSEMFSGNSKLLFFYADWCPHCKSFKPIWKELENASLGVQMEGVDCTDNKAVPALAKEHNVSSFPTIILSQGGNNMEYKGDRTASAITAWVKSNQ